METCSIIKLLFSSYSSQLSYKIIFFSGYPLSFTYVYPGKGHVLHLNFKVKKLVLHLKPFLELGISQCKTEFDRDNLRDLEEFLTNNFISPLSTRTNSNKLCDFERCFQEQKIQF